jgi:hypothetical protein
MKKKCNTMFLCAPITLPSLETIQIVLVESVPAPVSVTRSIFGPLSPIAPPSISEMVHSASKGLLVAYDYVMLIISTTNRHD